MFNFIRRFFQRRKPDTVPYYDFATKTVVRIPKSELSPGAILVKMEGHDEPFYADSSELKSGEYRHGPFNEELVGLMSTLMTDLEDVYPKSLAEWEDGFRRDRNAEREIAGWLHLAAVLKVMTGRFNFGPAERKECFKILVACFTGSRDTVRERSDPELLPPAQVDQAIKYFYEGGCK